MYLRTKPPQFGFDQLGLFLPKSSTLDTVDSTVLSLSLIQLNPTAVIIRNARLVSGRLVSAYVH